MIHLRSVTKSFKQSSGPMLMRQHLTHLFKRRPAERFVALKNISFSLGRGESLAVVGTNGAGKSTLLALVAGLVQPDSGTISVDGRVAALLDLGSGFHLDLTGRENLSLNASLIGISRKRTEQVLEQILDFAEIGAFIDQPLRTYSSGMMMRLAFSVAVHVDPDVLLIDEILTVGDAGFQVKCLRKVHELRGAGKTLLCVSHAQGALDGLCDRAIWLDRGDLMMDGTLQEVMDAYRGMRTAPR